uniref:Uncharacterized protein n=1 Tax=Oryza rufipogon TaxID=4529 RepID=A0A0E0PD53_ORYRU
MSSSAIEAMDELIQLAESMRQAASLLGCQQVGDAPAAARASSSPSTSSPRPQRRSHPPPASLHAPAVLDAIDDDDEAVGKLKSVLDNGEGDLDEVVLQAEELMAPLESHYNGWRRWL